METDASLGAAAARPEAHALAFERIFREFAPYVARVLPRLGVAAADLDDVMQEVFLAIHRALPGFERRSSEKSWLYGICLRVCSNYRRRAFRRRERPLEAVPEAPDDASQERVLDARRALLRLDAALAQLPHSQREVFVLFEIEQLSMREIAAALGCSQFTLYARLHAARRAVRAAMPSSTSEADDV